MCFRAYADSEGPDQPAHSQSDLGLHCQLTLLLATTECKNGEKRSGYFAHAHDDLNLCFLRMFEDTFSLGAAHIIV